MAAPQGVSLELSHPHYIYDIDVSICLLGGSNACVAVTQQIDVGNLEQSVVCGNSASQNEAITQYCYVIPQACRTGCIVVV